MGQVTYEQADLLLRLYELRREPRLRQAREWIAKFDAKTAEEMKDKYPAGSDADASFRMVLSYWEMVAGIGNRGLIDQDLFFENAGEAWFVWEKVREVVPSLRAHYKHPRMWEQLETLAKRIGEWRQQRAAAIPAVSKSTSTATKN